MSCRLRFAIVVGLCMLPQVIQAADDPLEAIPDDAAAVVRFKAPKQTIEKAAMFAARVEPAWGELVRQNAQGMGVGISNPTLAGVDQSHDWWLAVFPREEKEPAVVFAIPASDADAMKQALGEAFTTAAFDKWLLYSEEAAAVEKVAARLKKEGKSIATVIDKESRETMDAGDVAVFVNVKNLTGMYKEQIDDGEAQVEAALEQFRAILEQAQAQQPGFNFGAIIEMYAAMAKAGFQLLRDADAFVYAVTVNNDSVAVDQRLALRAGTKTAAFFESSQPAAGNLLAKLPAAQLAYFEFHGQIGELVKWGVNLSKQLLAGGDDPEKTRELDEVLAEYAKLKFGGYAGSFGLGDLENGALRSVVVMQAAPADKLRGLTRRMVKAMQIVELAGFKQEVELKEDAEEYGKRKADLMVIKQQFNQELDPLGIQQRLAEAMYGPDGMMTRIVYLDDGVLQTLGGGRGAMEQALETVGGKTMLNADNEVTAARARLLPKANLVALIDLPTLVTRVARLVVGSGQLPIPIDPDALDELKVDESYLGISFAAAPQAIRVRTSVPVRHVQGMHKIATFFQNLNAEQQ